MWLNRPGPTKSDSEFLRLKVMLVASNSGSGAIPGKMLLARIMANNRIGDFLG